MTLATEDLFKSSRIEYCKLKHRMEVGAYEVTDRNHDLLQTIATHPTNSLFPAIRRKKE